MAEKRIVTKHGIFLGNMYDPLELRISWPEEYCDQGESEFHSRARISKWMMTKTIGPPLATQDYEEADLRGMGFVGVYFDEEAGDIVRSAEEVSLSFPGGMTDVDHLGYAIWRIFQERHKND